MFDKVLNAQMPPPRYGLWGISRGTKGGLWHRAVCVTVDDTGATTRVLAHHMCDADPADLSFNQFLASVRFAHAAEEFTLATNDTGTIDLLRRAGVGYNLTRRFDDFHAALLVAPGLTRDQIKPYLELIHATACTGIDEFRGIAYL